MKVRETLFTRGTIRLYLEFVSWTAIAMAIAGVCSIPLFQEKSNSLPVYVDEARTQFSELPADDDGLRRWLAEQPGVPEIEVERTEPDVVLLRFASPGNLVPPWEELGYKRIRGVTTSYNVDLFNVVTEPHSLLVLATMGQVGFFVAGVFWWRRLKRSKVPLPPLWVRPTRRHLAVGFAAGLLLIAFGFFHEWLVGLIVPEVNSEPVWSAIRDLPLGWAGGVVLVGALLAPVCEEFFFRGVMFGSAVGRGRMGLGIVLSTLLFAAVHLNPVNLAFYCVAGGLLAILYHRTGSLVPGILAHGLNNAVAFGLLLLF